MSFAAANVINAVDVLQYSSIHVTTTDKKKPKTPKKTNWKYTWKILFIMEITKLFSNQLLAYELIQQNSVFICVWLEALHIIALLRFCCFYLHMHFLTASYLMTIIHLG